MLNLLGLQLVEWHARVFASEASNSEIHPLLRATRWSCGSGAPPNRSRRPFEAARLEAARVGFRTLVAGSGLGETVALQSLQEDPAVLPCHVRLNRCHRPVRSQNSE